MTRLVNGLRMAAKMLRPRIWCGSFYESLKSINNLAERQIRRLS
ncbi:hypothetical protein ACJZL1_06395 [Wolbachia endosymbiont of Rhagoletis indifferens]|nr:MULTISPECIES: hypothetical protein [unclassified Wolbachia]